MSTLGKGMIALALAGALSGALAGCKDKKATPEGVQAAEGAKLLPRSVTDDMPAYDTRRSKPPLADPELAAPAPNPGSANTAADDGAPGTPEATPAEETTAPPTPAASGALTPDAG